MTELHEYVDRIASEIKRIYEADWTDEERERMEEEGEACNLYDYFADALDVEYTVDRDLRYLGARIAVTLGGPNVYVNTRTGDVEGFWGCDRASAWIPREICDEIDAIFEEEFDARIECR